MPHQRENQAADNLHFLDHAAGTPILPVAAKVMAEVLSGTFGNPSGAHRLAREAQLVLDESREVLADALGAEPGEVIFTAGGTEADNLAIFGVVEARRAGEAAGTVLCSAIEHHAVLEPVEYLGGATIAVGADGLVDLLALEGLLSSEVTLVSVMAVNNETGIVQPIQQVVDLVRRLAPHALVHCDAVQAVAWLDVATLCRGVDLISISAHKFGGPKGVGALVARKQALPDSQLVPRFHGGGQERGRRGGTQNVAGIAAMAAALADTLTNRESEAERVLSLREQLIEGICAGVEADGGSWYRTAPASATTPNIAHLCFDEVENEALLFLLGEQNIMASAASSCSSGAMEPSHVLSAMDLPASLALGSLRLSLGKTSSTADINAAIEAVPAAVARLRKLGS